MPRFRNLLPVSYAPRFLLVMDLDGTILTNGVAAPEVHRLLEEVTVLDGGTVLATARPWRFVDSLGLRGMDAVISSSGSLTHIKRFRVAERTMAPSEIEESLQLIEDRSESPGFTRAAFLGSDHEYEIVALGEGESLDLLASRIAPPRELRVVPPGRFADAVLGSRVLSLAGITVGPFDAARPATHEVNGVRLRTFDDRRFGSTIRWIEALPAEVSKGSALLGLMGRWEDGDPPMIIAAGDAPADLTMHPIVDLFVAPADASEQVRTAAGLLADADHGPDFCRYLIRVLPDLVGARA